ncbi:MAG: DUF58 domain-containing protein [Verrucomicrobiia bacterium]
MSRPASSQAPSPVSSALLRRLEWRVRHVADTIVSGEYRSAFRGRGREFDQVVKYQYGDDLRDIDWNVTARRGEPYRKRFIEEREVTLALLVEDTPSLQFGSDSTSKREALAELAGLLSLVAAANRDRLAILHAAPGSHWFLPPARGLRAIRASAARLLDQAAPASTTPAPRTSPGVSSSEPSLATPSSSGLATSPPDPNPNSGRPSAAASRPSASGSKTPGNPSSPTSAPSPPTTPPPATSSPSIPPPAPPGAPTDVGSLSATKPSTNSFPTPPHA